MAGSRLGGRHYARVGRWARLRQHKSPPGLSLAGSERKCARDTGNGRPLTRSSLLTQGAKGRPSRIWSFLTGSGLKRDYCCKPGCRLSAQPNGRPRLQPPHPTLRRGRVMAGMGRSMGVGSGGGDKYFWPTLISHLPPLSHTLRTQPTRCYYELRRGLSAAIEECALHPRRR